jgi:prophage regulatory protein
LQPVTVGEVFLSAAGALWSVRRDTMKLLRSKDVIKITGLSRMTIWRLEKAGKFPPRRRLGVNSVAWLEGDVDAWISSRPAIPATRSA